MAIEDHIFKADPKLPTRCIQCGAKSSNHRHMNNARWFVYGPDGKLLPEPIGDSEEDVIVCFCALSEMSREQFDADGYTAGPVQAMR